MRTFGPATRTGRGALRTAVVVVGFGALAACSTAPPGVSTPARTPAPPTSVPTVTEGGVAGPAGTKTCPYAESNRAAPQDAMRSSAFNTKAAVRVSYKASNIDLTPGVPRVVTSSGEDAPDEGMQWTQIPIRAHFVSGPQYKLTYSNFGLYDSYRVSCKAGSKYDSVLPAGTALDEVALDGTHKDVVTNLVFQTPSGTDLKTYTLTFGDDADGTGLAQVAWKNG